MNNYIKIINESMLSYLPEENLLEKELIKSIKYSIKAGGKRVRPSFTLEFAKVCGSTVEKALPFACAVEFIHTYSLIHDDLPCMDDDDFRRGKKANHIVFGEDTALLAGDALQMLAFEAMLNNNTLEEIGVKNAGKAAFVLAKYAGLSGMVGGQVIDLLYEEKAATLKVLQEKDSKKTAALIKAACEMGCIIANAEEKQVKAAREFGENIGIAFQITDDILDITSTDELLGKPTGSDKDNNKSTYVSLLGLEKCKELVKELTNNAVNALNSFEGDTTKLKDFAIELSKRKS